VEDKPAENASDENKGEAEKKDETEDKPAEDA
jgi:hypothetical protein